MKLMLFIAPTKNYIKNYTKNYIKNYIKNK